MIFRRKFVKNGFVRIGNLNCSHSKMDVCAKGGTRAVVGKGMEDRSERG